MPIPQSSDSTPKINSLRPPFGSIIGSSGSRRNKESVARFDDSTLISPRDRKALNEPINQYGAGKPVGEQQRYIIVNQFGLPSQIPLNPAGEVLTISLWVVLIASLLSILRILFIFFARIWPRSPNSNRLSLLQERQLLLRANQQLRDKAQNLQRGAIEAYLAHRAGQLSRGECRRIMINCYLVLPPIVDMMLDWVGSGEPIPKAVEESFTMAVNSDTVTGVSPAV